jgi:hypothetical protein
LITWMIFGEKYRSWMSSVCTRWFKYDRDKLWLIYTQILPVIFEPPFSVVRFVFRSPRLGPNIFLSTPFSRTLSLYSSPSRKRTKRKKIS